jgi:hypothetical protein
MIGDHPSFTHPTNRDIRLWRYMNLSKFISLLQTEKLYFARARNLVSDDPFEGAITQLDARWPDLVLQFRETHEQLAGWRGVPEATLRYIAKDWSEGHKNSLNWLCVSCWHMNEHESAAMWKLYSQSSDAICIQTTFEKLAFELPDFVYAGMVDYIDYELGTISQDNIFNRFLRKRKSFEHERELRALMIFVETAGKWPTRLASQAVKAHSFQSTSPR